MSKKQDYLRSEIEIAHRNAKAADTLGRYTEASWREERGKELMEELSKELGYDSAYEQRRL